MQPAPATTTADLIYGFRKSCGSFAIFAAIQRTLAGRTPGAALILSLLGQFDQLLDGIAISFKGVFNALWHLIWHVGQCYAGIFIKSRHAPSSASSPPSL
jgi:hypothetical protein